MAIEIVPKEKIKVPLKENLLFYLSLILFIFSLATSFFLDYCQKKNFDILEEIEMILIKEKTKEEIRIEQKMLGVKKKIEDFSFLLSSHKKNTNFFKFLEKTTHPRILFHDLILETEEGKVNLSGKTENLKILGQQLLIFNREQFIEKAELLNTKIGKEGGIEFSIELSLNPEIFK